MIAQLILSCSLLGLTSQAVCRDITDADRRGFDDSSPVMLDVDGDGRPDRIKPRFYKTRAHRGALASVGEKFSEVDWLAFDLITTRGRSLKSFFEYNYGEDGVRYWVWALVPCDFNRDGRVDLKFYSGDDTSDETVILRNTGRVFKIHSRKVEVYNN